jgi:hypothetical protein
MGSTILAIPKEVIKLKKKVGKGAVGLRDKETHKIIAVYPDKVNDLSGETQKRVKDWYYVQGCINEDILRHSYVDLIRENELNK